MKKKTLLIIGISVVLLVGGALGYRAFASSRSAEGTDVQTATVQRGSLDATLGASGNTRSGQSATISWQTSGKVGEVTLKPGDFVQEDQVLVSLDPNTLSTDLIEAKQQLIDAQQALDDLLNSKLQQAQALTAVEDAQITEIMNLLLALNKERGLTLVIVTHDPSIAAQTRRVIRLRDGLIDDGVAHPSESGIAPTDEEQVSP